MFKRIFAWTVCVVLLLSVCSQAVSARAATTTFSLSVNDGKAGETVTVSLSLSAESYFTNCTFYVHYDPNVVSYVTDSETPGPISPSTSMLYVMDHQDQNYVKGAYVTVKGIKKEGVLLSLDFTVLKEAATTFSLSFDECVGVDENDTEFDVSYQVSACTLNAHAAPAPTSASPAVTTAAPAPTTAATPVAPTSAAQPAAPTAAPAVPQGTTAAGQNTPGVVITTANTPVGQNPVLPTTVPTDAQGNTLATLPTTVMTDEFGATVTQPVAENVRTTTTITPAPAPVGQSVPSVLGILLIVFACILIAGGVTIAAVMARKKSAAAAETSSEETPAEEVPAEETPAEEAPAQEAATEETPAEETPTDAE